MQVRANVANTLLTMNQGSTVQKLGMHEGMHEAKYRLSLPLLSTIQSIIVFMKPAFTGTLDPFNTETQLHVLFI